MFSEVGRQQAADAFVRKEHVVVPQQTSLGFVRFVLCLQGRVRNDLRQERKTHREQESCINRRCGSTSKSFSAAKHKEKNKHSLL